MNKTETVTLFNDMCLMVPVRLIDKRIQWEPFDSLTTKAIFTNRGIIISATLYFNEAGQLINFTSDDRSALQDDGKLKHVRWTTPISDYKEFEGRKIPTIGKTIWHYPEGDFTYGVFELKNIAYNLTKNN